MAELNQEVAQEEQTQQSTQVVTDPEAGMTTEEKLLKRSDEIKQVLDNIQKEEVDPSVYTQVLEDFTDEKKAELQEIVEEVNDPIGEKTRTIKTIDGRPHNSVMWQEVWMKEGSITKYGDFYIKGYGVVGIGSGTSSPARVPLPSDIEFDYLAINYASIYARPKAGQGKDNSLYCLGGNNGGQLGNGTTTALTLPYEKIFDSRVKKVIPISRNVDNQVCVVYVLLESGYLYGCGRNANGELGVGNTTQTNSWTLLASGVLDVYATAYNAFIVKSDGVYCAGQNQSSMLGSGSTGSKTSWTIVNGNFIDIKNIKTEVYWDGSSWQGGTILQNGNKLLACGSNNNNQILDANTTDQKNFVEILDSDGTPLVLQDGADFTRTRQNIAILMPNAGNTEFWIRGQNTYGYGNTDTTLNIKLHKTKTFDGLGWRLEVPDRYDSSEASFFVFNEERQEAWAFGKNASNGLGVGDSTDTKEFKKIILPRKAIKQFEIGLQWGGQSIGSLVAVIDGEVYACGNTTNGRVDFQTTTFQKQS